MNVDILIALVHSNPPIWDKTDKRHSNLKYVDKIWEDIADEMNVQKKVVKDKWKNLRDQFRSYLIKFPELRAEPLGDGDPTFEPSWPFFKVLYFLKGQIKKRSCVKRATNAKRSVNDNAVAEDVEDNVEFVGNEDEPNTSNRTFDTGDGDRKCLVKNHNHKRKSDSFDAQVNENVNKNKRLSNCDDSDGNFLSSLLPHLKKLSPRDKMLCQMDLQRVVFDYAYGVKNSGEYMARHNISSSDYDDTRQHENEAKRVVNM